MRRSEKEITDPSAIELVFRRASICRLGMVENGKAYMVPMNFGYEQGVLYFHSSAEGRKMRILKRAADVQFEIDILNGIGEGSKACKWTASYTSIMGDGQVVFITGKDEKARALNLIMEKYSGKKDWEFEDANLASATVFKLIAKNISCKGSD